MQTNVIIIDNFYHNAMATRNYILSTDFTVKGNYPGYRTKSYATESLKNHFEKIVDREINFIIDPDSYNGAFQYTTKDMDSWVHRDTTDWAGVLYLTPDAPVSGGTAFFRHKETGLEKIEPNTPPEIEKKLNDDSNDMSKWEMVDYVGNKFNRLILFRGKRSHRSMDYFGDNKFNGRLFQLFFFNEIGPLRPKQPPVEKSIPKQIAPAPVEQKEKREDPSITRVIEKVVKEERKKMKIAVLFFTTSRYEYLEPMLESFTKNIDFGDLDVYKILIDDYPLRRNIDKLNELKERYQIDKLVLNEKNEGYSVAWKIGWTHVPEDIDYIWHQEEDFTFNTVIDIKDLIKTFEESPTELTQITLKRQKWYDSNDFVDNIETGKIGKEIVSNDKTLIIHQTYFNSNPCLYPRWVIEEEYKINPQEGTIVAVLRNKYPNKYSAIYGKRTDPAMIEHIGNYNQGKKCLEGEPGYQYFGKYDPDKKYDSKLYLTEYKD